MKLLSWRYALTVFILATGYFITGWLGTRLSYSPDSVTLIWPPAGIALAGGLLCGHGVWPGVVMGEMAVLLANDLPVSVSLSVAVGNALAMLAGVGLLRRADFDQCLLRVRDVLSLAILGTAATLVSASIGSLSMTLGGIVPWPAFVSTWIKWWLGDTMGVLLVTPILLTGWVGKTAELPSPSLLKAVIAFLVLAVAAGISFGGWLGPNYLKFPLSFLPFPCLVWIALFMDMRRVSLAVLILSVIAVIGTTLELGPFHRSNIHESLALLWGFLATTGLTPLLLNAVLTERNRTVQVLRESEKKYRTLFEKAREAIIASDADGRIIEANPAAAAILGYTSPTELLGKLIASFYADAAQKEAILAKLLEKDYVDNFEATLIKRDDGGGRLIHILGSASLQRDQSGAVHRVEGIFSDITPYKQATEELRKAKESAEQANAAKSRFLAAASHDLRQPLQTISLLNGVVGNLARDREILEITQKLDEALSVMKDLLEALLDISKLEAGAIKPQISEFPVAELLNRMDVAFGQQAAAAGVNLRLVSCRARVHSDPVLLGRIVQNFLSNALHHAGASKILLGCRRQGMSLRIEVRDNGIGIPETQREAIFEAFYQLNNTARDRRKGFGLGLAIVKRTAQLLDHSIEVRSRPGKGSVFAVVVPTRYVHPSPVEDHLQRDTDTLRGALVLVIDDEPAVALSLRLLLESSGFRVITALTGSEALARLEKGTVRPDLVISDYRLPDGETGIQVVRCLKAILSENISVILLTGDTSPEQVRETQQSGFEVLYKPVESDRLIALIHRLLKMKNFGG